MPKRSCLRCRNWTRRGEFVKARIGRLRQRIWLCADQRSVPDGPALADSPQHSALCQQSRRTGLGADCIYQRSTGERTDVYVHEPWQCNGRCLVFQHRLLAVYQLHAGAGYQWVRRRSHLHTNQSERCVCRCERRQQSQVRAAISGAGELARPQHARREVRFLQRTTLPQHEAGVTRQVQLFLALDTRQYERFARQAERVHFARHLLPRFFA